MKKQRVNSQPLFASHRGVRFLGAHNTVKLPQEARFLSKFYFLQDTQTSRVHDTAESDSSVYMTQLSQTPQFASHRGVRLLVLHHTAESDSSVCITPRSQTPQCTYMTPLSQTYQCAWHCGVRLRGQQNTMEWGSLVGRIIAESINPAPEPEPKIINISVHL